VGIVGHLLYDSGYLEVTGVIPAENLSHRILIAKILVCRLFCDHYGIRISQDCLRVSCRKIIGEHGEKRGVCQEKPLFIEGDVSVPDSTGVTAGSNTCYFDNLRILILQDLGKNIGGAGYSRVTRFPEDNAAETVAVGVVRVIIEFVVDPEEDQDEACHPNGEACDIDERIPLVSSDVPECDLDVIFKHGCFSLRALLFNSLSEIHY
jgi:hypothetical protein